MRWSEYGAPLPWWLMLILWPLGLVVDIYEHVSDHWKPYTVFTVIVLLSAILYKVW